MKSFIALLVVVCALSIDAKLIRGLRDSRGLNNAIARTIAQTLAVQLRQQDTKSPVLPELPDPLEVENAELNFDELELEGLTGKVALRDGEVTGLSSVVDDLGISLTIPARITYKLHAGVLAAIGTYEVANVNLNGSIFIGAGHLEASVTNPDFEVVVSIIVNLITNRFTVTNVSINKLVFESVQGEAEGLTYNGEPVDWEAVNEDAKPVFDEFWVENRSAVEAAVKDLLADLLKDCKITDLIGGDYSCIALPETSNVSRARLAKEVLMYLI